jgi:hypothetical protein
MRIDSYRPGCGTVAVSLLTRRCTGKRLCLRPYEDRERIVLAMDAVFDTVFLPFKQDCLHLP